jgi:hypothetical protein
MLNEFPMNKVYEYRRETFHTANGSQLKNIDQAIQFVNQQGFIFFWPISGVLLPSLWVAVAGDRPVADAHDDPGHKTWGWKDSLLGKKKWFYAKVLRRKATIISLDILPFFYALSENYGAPEEDYLTLYEQGKLTKEAKVLYEALMTSGPLDTIALRRLSHMTSDESDSRFERALTDLQVNFQVLPIGVADVGTWHYAFIYEIVTRHYPDLLDLAQPIRESDARRKLLKLYLLSVGAAQMSDLMRLFRWDIKFTEQAINDLMKNGDLLRFPNKVFKNEWLVLPELVGD